ncbi:MAG: YbaB/EbfC family nucleoid-associated protein [Nocardia sp.]|nr:YbaB/EbfC family nucleoid-associated protein [Nocardia sp.]
MDRWRREALRSANSGLRTQIEGLLDTYEQQNPQLVEILRQLKNLRVQAYSPDGSVAVTVDTGGVLTDLMLTPAALRKTPEQLATTILDAVREAARSAQEQHRLLISPAAEAAAVPDLPDILPEAPSVHEVRAYFLDEENRER